MIYFEACEEALASATVLADRLRDLAVRQISETSDIYHVRQALRDIADDLEGLADTLSLPC